MKKQMILGLAMAMAAVGTPCFAQETPTVPASSPASTQAEPVAAPKPGDTIYDNTGTSVGTVDSVAGQSLVIATTKGKATIPGASLTTGDKGLTINTTKAQLYAAIQAANTGRATN